MIVLPGRDVLGQPEERPLARPALLQVCAGPARQQMRPEQPSDDSALYYNSPCVSLNHNKLIQPVGILLLLQGWL